MSSRHLRDSSRHSGENSNHSKESSRSKGSSRHSRENLVISLADSRHSRGNSKRYSSRSIADGGGMGSRHSRHANHGQSYHSSTIDYVAPASSQDGAERYSREVSSKNYPFIYRKKRRRKRAIIAVAVVFTALLVGGGAAAFGYVSYLNGQFHSGIDDMSALNEVLVSDREENDPFYMLLLGTDGRDEDEADRTDTIILGRVDPEAKQVVLISIPRDTMIQLDGVGTTKINAAHAYYGPAGAVEAVEEFAGVEISHYAEVDFSGFVDLVDALGGVEVDVPIEIDDDDAGGYVAAGLQTLNGEQALIFCRSRDTSIGDYQRQANQRIFLQALASKVLSSDAATMATSISAIASAVSTDMDASEILAIAMTLRGMDSSSIYTYTVPSYTSTIDEVSYVIADEDEWESMMEIVDSGGIPEAQSWEIAGVVPDEYNSAANVSSSSGQASDIDRSAYTVTVRNGGGVEGTAAEVASFLESEGYVIGETGNADQFVYEQTLVIYNDDDDASIASDILGLLGMGTTVQSAGRYSFDTDILVMVGTDWTG